MLRFDNVGLRYGVGPEVLRDLDFSIAPQSFQFLTGPSGAGKTTMLKLMLLSLKPTRGTIHIFGAEAGALSQGRDHRAAGGASASCSRISACSTI